MDLGYDEVGNEVLEVVDKVREKWFPELLSAKIKVVFSLKKATHGGGIVLARIVKPNNLNKFLTKEIAPSDGYDYILILDQKCYEIASEEDRIRVIRHEFRHTFVDFESEGNQYRLVDHDITDFYSEVELNSEDPRWRQRLGQIVYDLYEQEKDEQKGVLKRRRHR
jgi:hypothetical protein